MVVEVGLFLVVLSGTNWFRLRAEGALFTVLVTGMIISGFAAFVAGTISLIKFEDRSPVVIFAAGFGFIAILRAIGGKTKSSIR